MSAIGTATLFGRLVNLNVLHNEVACVEALGVGVCFSVSKKTEEIFGRFDRPASKRDSKLLS